MSFPYKLWYLLQQQKQNNEKNVKHDVQCWLDTQLDWYEITEKAATKTADNSENMNNMNVNFLLSAV